MPRSIPTLNLNRAAHELGDEYYRCVSASNKSRSDIEHCQDLGRLYLAALESLQTHLQSLHPNSEVDVLVQATETHIALIRKDLTTS